MSIQIYFPGPYGDAITEDIRKHQYLINRDVEQYILEYEVCGTRFIILIYVNLFDQGDI